MRTWIAKIYDTLHSSFWFLPSVMAVLAAALGVGLLVFDTGREVPLPFFLKWLAVRDVSSARTLLTTIIGAIITTLSVVFSITIVSLTMAASQLGPRLLRSFIRDRGTQTVLGVFVGTSVYCLVVLGGVEGLGEEAPPPQLAMIGAQGVTLVSLGTLIYFIHHVATSIQAPYVVAEVAAELETGIDHHFPDSLDPDQQPETPPGLPDGEFHAVEAWRSDYIQAVNLAGLLSLASKHDLVLVLRRRPGDFVGQGDPMVEVHPAGAWQDWLEGHIRDAFYMGSARSATQNLEFIIDQLVEMAVRALSPGINDPFTAINCIDRLGAGLRRLAGKRIPPPFRYDGQGQLRLVLDQTRFPGLVDAAFNQIRQNAADHPAVLIRLLETLAVLARHTRLPEQRRVLRRHAVMAHRAALATPEPLDRHDIQRRYAAVLAALDHANDTP